MAALALIVLFSPTSAFAVSETLAQGLHSSEAKIISISKETDEGISYEKPSSLNWVNVSCNGCGVYSTSAKISFYFNAGGLAPGTYTGAVPIYLHSPEGTRLIRVETVTLTVVPLTIVPEPSIVDITLAEGLHTAEAEVVTITVSGPGAGNYHVRDHVDVPWISVYNGYSCISIPIGTSCTIKILANTGGLEPGTYSSSVTLTSGSAVETVTVNLTVVPLTLVAEPSVVDITLAEGLHTAEAEVITITVSGPGAGNYHVRDHKDVPWISVYNGYSCISIPIGTSCQIKIMANAGGLEPGAYSWPVTLTSGSAVETVTVNLTVVPPVIEVVPTSLSATLGEGLQSVSSEDFTITVSGPGAGTFPVSLSDDRTWMNTYAYCYNISDGQSCAGMAWLNAGGLTPGAYTGTVTVKSRSTEVSLPVTLTVEPLEITLEPTSINVVKTTGCETVPQSNTFDITVTGEGKGYVRASVSESEVWFYGGSSGCYMPVGGTCEGYVYISSYILNNYPPAVYEGTVKVTARSSEETLPVTLAIDQAPQVESSGGVIDCASYLAEFTIRPNTECGWSYAVDFGATPGSMQTVDVGSSSGRGRGPVTITSTFGGLAAGNDYYYRIIVSNGAGSTPGELMTINKADFPEACAPPPPPEEECDDVWYKDTDDDGYSDGETIVQCTRPDGYKLASELSSTSGDCDDSNDDTNPGAEEACGDGVDNNCSGGTDEGCCDIKHVRVTPDEVSPTIPAGGKPSTDNSGGNTQAEVTVELVDAAPPSGCTVNFEVEAIANSGGHDHHSTGRHHGTLSQTTLSFSYGEEGPKGVTYTSSVVSGRELIKAKLVNSGDEMTIGLDVRFRPSLYELGSSSYYRLTGEYGKPGVTSLHKRNHFGRGLTNYRVKGIARDYFNEIEATLGINDMSLVWGGLFDIFNNWSPDHDWHRTGKSVDIDQCAMPVPSDSSAVCTKSNGDTVNGYISVDRVRIEELCNLHSGYIVAEATIHCEL